jgi:hypothetical protein
MLAYLLMASLLGRLRRKSLSEDAKSALFSELLQPQSACPGRSQVSRLSPFLFLVPGTHMFSTVCYSIASLETRCELSCLLALSICLSKGQTHKGVPGSLGVTYLFILSCESL